MTGGPESKKNILSYWFANSRSREIIVNGQFIEGKELEKLSDVISDIEKWLAEYFSVFTQVFNNRFSGEAIRAEIKAEEVPGIMQVLATFLKSNISHLKGPYEDMVLFSMRELNSTETDSGIYQDHSLTEVVPMHRFNIAENEQAPNKKVSIGVFRSENKPYHYQLIWKIF